MARRAKLFASAHHTSTSASEQASVLFRDDFVQGEKYQVVSYARVISYTKQNPNLLLNKENILAYDIKFIQLISENVHFRQQSKLTLFHFQSYQLHYHHQISDLHYFLNHFFQNVFLNHVHCPQSKDKFSLKDVHNILNAISRYK